MFTKTDSKSKLKIKLKKVLNDYQIMAEKDPDRLRLALPAQEVWRFFVDGHRQACDVDLNLFINSKVLTHPLRANYYDFTLDRIKHTAAVTDQWPQWLKSLHLDNQLQEIVTVKELLQFCQGWFLFERRERGYLKGLFRGFNFIFEQQHELDLDFILRLHAMATREVENTNYLKHKEARVGTIRDNSRVYIGFALSPKNASKQGICELLQLEEGYLDYKFKIKSDEKENERLLEKMERSRSPAQASTHLYRYVIEENTSPLFFCSTETNHTSLTFKARLYIKEYHSAISQNLSLLDKLSCIVTLVQSLERLHVFIDGNCRTFCMLLLNHLLIKNGFPLCIQVDPNRFDMYSHQELLLSVIEGMENTFTLLRTGELFDVNTNELIDISKRPNALGVSYEYFESVVTMEERARRRVVVRMPASKRSLEEVEPEETFKKSRYSKNG